jgi:hypothetical protein
MGRYEITCLNCTPPHGSVQSIYAVGGQEGGGWKLTVKEVIWNIRSNRSESLYGTKA